MLHSKGKIHPNCRIESNKNYFEVSSSNKPVTLGVDVGVVPLANGKLLMLMDMEGIHNKDHPGLSVMLGSLLQLTKHVCFMSTTFDDTVIEQSLMRLIGCKIICEGGEVTNSNWPFLHLLFNKQNDDVKITSEDVFERVAECSNGQVRFTK